MKDVPVDLPDELHIATIMERADPHDAFVSERFARMDDLPAQAIIGTSSLRRQCQLRARFPGCAWLDLRGNVNTRLQKLKSGECDAVILAAAGLKRLGLEHVITQILPSDVSLPAIGQGALGIECRREDARMHELLAPLHHRETAICVAAERAVNQHLQGGCQVPIAGYAILRDGGILLRALVASPDGTDVLRAQSTGRMNEAEALGLTVAEDLLSQGAGDILRAAGFE
jgi:hydroxymethylbilane synthase